MPRRGDPHVGYYRANRAGEVANALGCFISVFALGLGSVMLVLGYTRGDRCKMRVIDTSSWNDPLLDGNLIKWFKYTGSLYLVVGTWANCTIGVFPSVLRSCCPGVGGACADLLAGLCGTMILFVLYFITLLCTLLGSLWIYLAERARTDEDSTHPGDPNYCAPEIWVTAQVIIYVFWFVTAFGVQAVIAKIFKSCRSADSLYKDAILGKPPTRKNRREDHI